MEQGNQKRTTNRRQAIRQQARGSVRVECHGNALGLGNNIGHACLDISETGIRLIVNVELKERQECEILIHAMGYRKPLKAIADVRWIVPTDDGRFCVGLEFQKRLRYKDVIALGRP